MFAFIYNDALRDNSYNDLIFCVACVLLVVEILRNEVAQDAKQRQKAKDVTPWIGYQCGDTPLKHRCVRPKDAKTGNLVLLDVRNAGNNQAVLLGEWDGHYQLGTVSTRQVDDTSSVNDVSAEPKEYLLHLVMWEPYFKDADGEYRPLWVENALRAKKADAQLPSKWQDVVRYPWCPIKQLPLAHSRKLLNRPDFNPPKKNLVRNYLNSGVDCHKQPKGYRHTQKAGTVRHVFQFDKHERRKNIIHFNAMSQSDILVEMSRTEGYDGVDYIYNSQKIICIQHGPFVVATCVLNKFPATLLSLNVTMC